MKKIKYYLLLSCNIVIIIMLSLLLIKYTKYEPEDVNKDGIVDIRDLLRVQKKILGEI